VVTAVGPTDLHGFDLYPTNLRKDIVVTAVLSYTGLTCTLPTYVKTYWRLQY
jgi:hypothetical protein